jgi:hypothetical protein
VIDRNVNGRILGYEGIYRRTGIKWIKGNLKLFLYVISLVLLNQAI